MTDVYSLGRGSSAPPLPKDIRAAWARLHASQRPHASPFLHPAYAEAVAATRNDVQVLVEGPGHELTSVIAIVRKGANALTLGGRLSDVHAPLYDAGVASASHDVPAWLHGAALRRWRFDRLPEGNVPAAAFVWKTLSAPYLDLSGGFDPYRAARRAAGSEVIDQAMRKGRKLAREVAPLRFLWHDDSQAILAQLLAWKGEQRRQSASPDVLKEPWARAALEHLIVERDAGVSALVCSLWAGERLVAAHAGIATQDILVWWVPAYEPALAEYSPGLVLMVELIREAAARGYQRIDLGPGDERYKLSLATGTVALVSGELDLSRWRGALHRTLRRTRERIRSTTLERAYAATKAALRRASHAARGR